MEFGFAPVQYHDKFDAIARRAGYARALSAMRDNVLNHRYRQHW
jgi:hypothetical protein